MCKGITLFPTFPTIFTLIMYEYPKLRDRLTFKRVGKQVNFWTGGWKNVLFDLEKLEKSVFFAKKGYNFIFC